MIYNTLMLTILIFVFWKSTDFQKLYFIILLVPIFVILIGYNFESQISVFNPQIQTKEMYEKGLAVAFLYLAFLKIGFLMSKRITGLNKEFKFPGFSFQIGIIIIFTFLLYLNSPKSTIFGGYRYGVTDYDKVIPINTIPISFFLLIIFCLYSMKKSGSFEGVKKYIILMISFYGIMILGLFTGNRVEQLGAICAIYLLFAGYVEPRKKKYYTAIILFLIILAWIIGFMRSGSLNINRVISSFATFSDIANTYLIAIAIIDTGKENYFGFKVLSDILLSTLPSSVTPFERPLPLARFYHEYYKTMGGAYWFGVVYICFGIFGFVYCWLVGFIMGSIEKSNSFRNWIGLVYLLLAVISYRWLYYGGISVYKSLITLGMIILLYRFMVYVVPLRGRI